MEDEMRKLYSCAICNNLFDQATALKRCNHIFCFRCIYGKITEHDWKCCPVCYVELGPDPLKILRHDDPLLLSMESNNFIREQDVEDTGSYQEESETESESSEDEETESDDMETGSECDEPRP
ncbi:putative transcription factor C2H2 family [Arabidopsis thaliana]|uniref:Zinc finger RING-type n=1 Tax=Arabidopsis thaliana x Arabidopsis arenosa TaxID=1240361 RepID=A0A8T2GMM6_9BRAS|nr:Zinc finger RING-type [Arabidopsis thaliana x Arabidopsis arenosa]